MSRVFIFAILTSAVFADETVFEYPPVPRSCEKLIDLNETYALGPAVINTVKECSRHSIQERENLTDYAELIVEVYQAINKHRCSFVRNPDIEEQLVKCVVDNGFDKFNIEEAKTHLTMNGTVNLVFGIKQCIKSQKIFECINKKFSAKKINTPELIECKNSIFDGFEVTTAWCIKESPLEINGVENFLPSYLLVLSAFMIVEFAMFSGF